MHAPTVAADSQTRHRTGTASLARAILAGFAASLTMLLMFLVAYNLARLLSAAPSPTWPALERPSIIHPASWVTPAPGEARYSTDVLEPQRLWLINLTHNRLIDAGLSDVYLAAGVYFAGGLLWAVIYALVEPRLSGPPWRRGATFALVPALVSLVVVLPLFGGGLFGFALGAGPLPAIGNLLLHLVYGAVLGVVYGPLGDLDASTLERPSGRLDGATGDSYERAAALALIGGLVVGALAGVIISLGSGGNADLPLLGAASGLVVGCALLGAVIGLFVGSFLGLARSPAGGDDA
jgi:hypothetical protein